MSIFFLKFCHSFDWQVGLPLRVRPLSQLDSLSPTTIINRKRVVYIYVFHAFDFQELFMSHLSELLLLEQD